MEREACVCDHGFERSDLCAEIIIIIIIINSASKATSPECVCVCVCVFFPFILDTKFVGRTSRGHTGFLIHFLSAVRALVFLARRIQPFFSLVDREVEFCVLTI